MKVLALSFFVCVLLLGCYVKSLRPMSTFSSQSIHSMTLLPKLENPLKGFKFMQSRDGHSEKKSRFGRRDSLQMVSNEIFDVIDEGPIPVDDRVFTINGWRWHTTSVIKDIEKFRAVITQLRESFKSVVYDDSSLKEASTKTTMVESNTASERIVRISTVQLEQSQQIQKCFNFVYGFNWRALMKVEASMFFPWVKNLLPSKYSHLMNNITVEHDAVKELSLRLEQKCSEYNDKVAKRKLAYTPSNDKTKKVASPKLMEQQMINLEHQNFLLSIEDILNQMQSRALRVQDVQENVLVPFIAAYVNKKAQDVFNRKVITSLGLINSQIHLVSMYEAIKDDAVEYSKFKKQIPKVAQAVVPLWKKRLYAPKIACFAKP